MKTIDKCVKTVPFKFYNILNMESGCQNDVQNYMVGDFDGVPVFLHEAEWALHNGLIPKGQLVAHKNGNTMDNDITNLFLVLENNEYGDLHMRKTFHEGECNLELIQKYFPDIYEKLTSMETLD